MELLKKGIIMRFLNNAWRRICIFMKWDKDAYCDCPNCGRLARYIDKEAGIYASGHCGAVPASLEFE